MRRIFLGAAFLLLFTCCAGAVEFHVAPGGDDRAPGTAEQPFATIARARDAVREWKRAGRGAEAATVTLHDGIHRLAQPLLLTPEDSGRDGAPVTYRARPGEKAVISGGVAVDGWRPHDDELWVARVAWATEQPGPFTQLFVNGIRRPRARTPNEGEYFYSQRLHLTDRQATPRCVGIVFQEGDLGAWAGDGDALICLFHNWVNSYNRVESADWERRSIRFARPAGAYFLGPSIRYYVENVFEALDTPGEWYLDQETGLLYYYPIPGESMEEAEVVAPVLSAVLVELRGEPEQGRFVEHIHFQGFSFQHSDADLSADYPHSVQGAHTQRGAVFATGARHCIIADCEFTRLGEHAISLRQGCAHNMVTRCHMHDLGGGGMYLSEGAPPTPDDWYLTAHNIVDNNLIHNGGIMFRAGCGVFLGGSASYNRIIHNEICDLSWMGVHLGWSWTGRAPAYTHHNEIGWNHIHHLGNGVLNDIGGIYTLGISPGTVLHHNVIHDITRFERGEEGYGGWGIYLDAGSSEIVVENNVVYNTRDGGLHLHCYGHPYGNTIRNNVFAYSDEGQMMRNADHEPDQGIHAAIERNIVYNANVRMLWGSNWAADSKFTSDRNLFWSEQGEPDFNGRSFAQWRETGRDVNSLVADPGFTDAPGRVFAVKSDSPALELGFEPIDMSSVGLHGPEEWTSLPRGLVHRTVEVAVPPEEVVAGRVVFDFEDYDVGETPEGAVPPDGQTRVVVTDDDPAAGARCLRFEDGPSEHAWKPHWFVRRAAGTGPLHLECEVRSDATRPVSFELEVRDWPHMATVAYVTGPHLRFTPEGIVMAADGAAWRTIGRFELGQWLHVEVTFQEGEGRPGVYRVRLGESGEAIEGLRFATDGFTHCNWIGFVGGDTKPGVFYVDEFRVE